VSVSVSNDDSRDGGPVSLREDTHEKSVYPPRPLSKKPFFSINGEIHREAA
jgi:hypothetical protein